MSPRGRTRGWPVPADFAAPPSAADRDALGRGRPGRPAGSAGTPAGAVRGGRRRRLLRRPARAHALPDRLHPRRGRGEGRRRLRAVPRRRRRRRRSWPIRATRSRPRREAPEARVVEAYSDLPSALAGADGVGRGAARRGRGRVRPARHLAAPGRRRAGRRARPGRGLARGRPGGQGAGRDRAHRGRLRGRRPGARRAAARDPARTRPRPTSRCGSNG